MKKRFKFKKKWLKLAAAVTIVAVIRDTVMRQALQTYQPPEDTQA